MATRKPSPVYAYVSVSREYGYGHVNIHVHELFGYSNGTLKVSCQTGGTSGQDGSYAWEHGISSDFSVIGPHALKQGYLLMRRVAHEMDKAAKAQGYPETFAEYALRVLRAAGVRKVYVNSRVNVGVSGKVTDLPCYDPRKQGDALRDIIGSLEASVL